MKLLRNKLVQSLGIYTIANIINSAIPFLLLPILTQYLSTEGYGVLTNFNSLINLLIPFVSMNLMASLQVIYVKRNEEMGSYVSTGMLVMIGLTLLCAGGFLLFDDQLSAATGVPKAFIAFTAAYATYQNVVEVLLSIWRMEDRAWLFGIFRIVRTAVELTIALVLIISFNWSFEGSIYALSWSYGAGALIALIILLRRGYLIWSFKMEHVKHLFAYGAPLIPHVLGSVVILYSDKLAITKYDGLGSNGIYSAGFMVGQAIGLLQNSFNQAWVPYVFNHLKTGEERVKYTIVKWTYIYFIGIIVVTLLFYLCTPLIFYFLGKAFQDGLSLVLWIALGFAFNGMYKMVSVYFFYAEKTQFIAGISIFTAVINIVFLMWMVPNYGYTGAAISTMTAFFIQFILTWIWSTRVIKMPWGNWKVWKKY